MKAGSQPLRCPKCDEITVPRGFIDETGRHHEVRVCPPCDKKAEERAAKQKEMEAKRAVSH
jgi:hypothetical protein